MTTKEVASELRTLATRITGSEPPEEPKQQPFRFTLENVGTTNNQMGFTRRDAAERMINHLACAVVDRDYPKEHRIKVLKDIFHVIETEVT